MKIYTKTGDDGTTQLFGGDRIIKSHPQVEAYGTLDELNASLGLALAHSSEKQHTIRSLLFEVQNTLFVLGGQLATSDPKWKSQIPDLQESDIEHLESWIDHTESELPPLKQFILPGGHTSSCYLHLARTICRRAERVLVSAHLDSTEIYIRYLNRLSDTLFVAARLANSLEKIEDTPWKKP